MKLYKKPNEKMLTFVGNVSHFRMNRFGVVLQELDSIDWLDGYVDVHYLSEDQSEPFRELAVKAGARKYYTPAKKELRYDFGRVPDKCEV